MFQPLGIRLVEPNSASLNTVDSIVKEFEDVFIQNVRIYKGTLIPVDIPIDPNANPIRIRWKARNVPLSKRSKIDAALKKLLAADVIESNSNTLEHQLFL